MSVKQSLFKVDATYELSQRVFRNRNVAVYDNPDYFLQIEQRVLCLIVRLQGEQN